MSAHADDLRTALSRAAAARDALKQSAETAKVAIRPSVITARAKERVREEAGPTLDSAKRVVADNPLPIAGLVLGALAFRFRKPLLRIGQEAIDTARPLARDLFRTRVGTAQSLFDHLVALGRERLPRR